MHETADFRSDKCAMPTPEMQAVVDDLMAAPRAKEIIGAHLEIEKIKQDFKDKKISRELATERLIQYRDKYDIAKCGENLLYWYSLMWSDSLKAGKNLK